MAFNPDDPIIAPVFVPSERKLTTFYIHSITISLVAGVKEKGSSMLVKWSQGYMDGGNYIANQTFENQFEGDAFVKLIEAEVTPGLSRYDEVKNAIWQFMEDQEVIPKGKIE